MKTWFLSKVRYQKQNDDGIIKRVTEEYLVDAMSYTEAEARTYEQLEQIVQGEFEIISIAKTNYVEILNFEDSDYWIKCKMSYMSVDDETEKGKKVSNLILVNAENPKQAYERLEENFSTMLVPFDIDLSGMTNIVNVFNYSEIE